MCVPPMILAQPFITNLISVRQSSQEKLTTPQIEHLLSEPPVDVLSSFIQLPQDLDISQKNDRGSCQMSTDRDGSIVQKGQ